MKLDPEVVRRAVAAALEEDVGSGDVTSDWTVPASSSGRAELVAKASGAIAGLEVAAEVFRQVDAAVVFEPKRIDGDRVEPGDVVAEVSGPVRGILSGERAALNFLQRMSGIATATRQYVAAVAGTGARILDTRKTAPGLRALDKYAVAAGGGHNHRLGLFDMLLLKENHIEAAGGIAPAVAAVRKAMAREKRSLSVEVEVETLEQLEEAVGAGVDRVLLDNMSPELMRAAVRRVAALGPARPELEASGNVRLETLREIAETGVDLISVGALTHSPQALDLSLCLRATE